MLTLQALSLGWCGGGHGGARAYGWCVAPSSSALESRHRGRPLAWRRKDGAGPLLALQPQTSMPPRAAAQRRAATRTICPALCVARASHESPLTASSGGDGAHQAGGVHGARVAWRGPRPRAAMGRGKNPNARQACACAQRFVCSLSERLSTNVSYQGGARRR